MTSHGHGLHQEEDCGSYHGDGDNPEGDGNRIIRVQEAVALEDCIVVFDWSVSHLACQKNEKRMWDRIADGDLSLEYDKAPFIVVQFYVLQNEHSLSTSKWQ